MVSPTFYWRHSRDSLITPVAVQLFQIVSKYEGRPFDEVKELIDSEYALLRGQDSQRHGGKIQTAISVYREAGWVDLSPDANGVAIIRVTDAGRQALGLLGELPDFLKAVPYFVIELLSRYQLNNPARPSETRAIEYDAQLRESNVFPYWTLFKIMRSCDNRVTSEELKRFVFQLKRSEEIEPTIKNLLQFRSEREAGVPQEELDRKYPPPLIGANSEPKYLMGRLGTQVGALPSVIRKEGADTWVIEPAYETFIDQIISNEPVFKEHLTENSWIADYGKAVPIDGESEIATRKIDLLPENDPVLVRVKALIDSGSRAVILSGPPGTSKTWYASRIAMQLAGDASRVKFIQFHPSFSYDDFVEGYVPTLASNSGIGMFEVVPKVFLSFCEIARQNGNNTHVLVIDEFTRGDASRIFGELLTYVEPSYRNEPFTLAYSGRTTSIPPNVVVLGTMNPYDRSVTELDDALERRFDRVAFEPKVETLKVLLSTAGASGELIGKIVGFFSVANKLSPHGFGHTYFVGVSSEADLIRTWNHKLRFVFEKMFRFDPNQLAEIRQAYKSLVREPDKLQ